MTMILREAKPSDADILYEWVNDPISRKSAFNSSEISYHEHVEWYKKCQDDEHIRQLICEDNGVEIGQVRFDIDDENAVLDYSIAPAYRLNGYGKMIVSLAIQYARDNMQYIKTITAEIRPENIASRRVLSDNGFNEVKDIYEITLDSEITGGLSHEVKDNLDLNECSRGGVLYLTNNSNGLDLFEWLNFRIKTVLYSDRLDLKQIISLEPELIISYNYNYLIDGKIIEYMSGNIINLHISYLPFNRGFSPNIWSLIEGTPRGVTIHRISEGLDEGEIIVQEKMYIDSAKETLRSSYDMLNSRIVELFKENWDDIASKQYSICAQEGKGTYHTSKELKELHRCVDFDWDDKEDEFLRKYKAVYESR